eukprot:XP_002940162.2 PREDICTED: uncharacterized protein LOC100485032 [Xenopus tropicalis]
MEQSVERLMEQLRAKAESRGDVWLRQQIGALMEAAPQQRERRRARPPERLSPEIAPRQKGRRRAASPSPAQAHSSRGRSGTGDRQGHRGASRAGAGAAATRERRAQNGASVRGARKEAPRPHAADLHLALEQRGEQTGTLTVGQDLPGTSGTQVPHRDLQGANEAAGSRGRSRRRILSCDSSSSSGEEPMISAATVIGEESLEGTQHRGATAAASSVQTGQLLVDPFLRACTVSGPRGAPLSGLVMGFGGREVAELVRQSVAPSTWARYSGVWDEWESVKRLYGEYGGAGGEREILIWWISRLCKRGITASSLDTKMAGLSFYFRVGGSQDHTKDTIIRQALKGYRRGKLVRDQRKPVTFNLLQQLSKELERTCFSAFEVILFRLAYSLAFFGAFRVSELVAPSKAVVGGLAYGDLIVASRQLHIVLRRSKTDQEGRGKNIVLQELEGHQLCPVTLFEQYKVMRPKQDGPLLVHEDGKFLSRYQFCSVLRKLLANLGMAANMYGSHSFRIGAATEAARWGLGDKAIKQVGRWTSNRFRAYVRVDKVEC